LDDAEIVEDVGLAGSVAEVAVERQCLSRAGDGGPIIAHIPVNGAQARENSRLPGTVTGLARRGQGGLVESGSLVPVALGVQEVSHGGRDGHGMLGAPAGRGIAGGRVQVGAFDLQPGGCLPGRGQLRHVVWLPAGRHRRDGGHLTGDVLAGGQRGVQVVVEQSADRFVRSGGVVGGGESLGVLAEQVVEFKVAGCEPGDQVLVIQALQAAAGSIHGRAVEGGGGTSVEAGAWDQAEAAEQPLLARGEAGAGQVERGADRQVLRVHEGQPVPGRRQVGGELARRPGGMVPHLAGEHPDRQRQVPAQAGDLTHRGIAGAQAVLPQLRHTPRNRSCTNSTQSRPPWPSSAIGQKLVRPCRHR
jgi:hypothetical protein